MKKLILLFFIIPFIYNYSQSFAVYPPELSKVGNINDEVAFNFTISNSSYGPINVYIKKEVTLIPNDWSASLCFEYCFAPTLDSVTTSSYNGTPLGIGMHRDASVHVFTSDTPGTAIIKFTVGNVSFPTDYVVYTLTTTVEAVSVGEETNIVKSFNLSQNYPNPFNPATKIEYSIPSSSNVKLDVYDILGNKVKSLVNKYQTSGSYSINFTGEGLSSGIYFYTLNAENKSITKKMILSK